MTLIFVCGIVFSSSLAATPFFANDAFTPNGIEWCEENFSLYQIMGNDFFTHHQHSIESRVCVNLYDDPLWTYVGPDRIDRLVEKSKFYVQLEIEESAREAKTGIIDPTPAKSHEIQLEEKAEVSIQEEDEITTQIEQPVIVENPPKEEQNGGGCLIATAAYGSELASQVQQLRELRDNTILKTSLGSSFLGEFNKFYYSFSPIIADIERENYLLRESIKIIISPLIASLSILSYIEIDSDFELLGYGTAIIILNVAFYFVTPTVVVFKIQRKFRRFFTK